MFDAHPVRRDPFAPLLDSDFAAMLRRLDRAGLATHAVPTAGAPQPMTVFDDGRTRINLGTNNYLGLAGDPQVVEAAVGALRQYGTSAAGSRMLNGTTRLHLTLEQELAEHYGTEDAVLTSAGVNANLAVLSTSCAPGDVLLVDAHAHASLHAAAAASRGTVARFTHNSAASLERRLSALAPEAGAVVVVDGVYSMSGEAAPLAAIAGLCRRFGARLVVDEAHGLGVLGEHGRGAAEEAGVLDRVDAVTVAFSKSLASVGGAVMTSRAVAEGIRCTSMPYVFSAANDPSAVAAALASLRVLRREPERMQRLRDNGDLLRRVLTECGAAPLPGRGAVIAVPTGEDDVTRRAWAAAHDAGVYTNAVAHPAVPRGKGLLRLVAMATHTQEQLVRAGEIVAAAVLAGRAPARDRDVAVMA
ncbi:aminotransferase class I/II-fold pyridoxal phosphate-dependent enzyme [Modestobacter sp. VKM Ac-2986]|uniref:aminotransferase class I/II-fold pyridoxal phosphate-dependent enzyme n=1 Tax=Modestobacter sp. VKM Ac-2986 TaxID=3004140 RepID=UPI0022AAA143|nr:aminotransferase class I/II-fold pyridoxal phosphate-dependent enzyme [Modestobacter sp. VKM Ac-2986]MCZ2827892.1 aminotransferase class I/II-fold pyridoxal phosphate-dependent enzyme [Modestobacter sp. VKM Ac-2986]